MGNLMLLMFTVRRMDNLSRAGCFRLQEFGAARALQSAKPPRPRATQ
jgi:hypothetical protein